MSRDYSQKFDDTEEDEEGEEGEGDKYSTISSVTARVLTHDEASKCLHILGKCDSGAKYAYLGLDASNRRLIDVSVIPTFKYVIFVNVSGNRLTSEALQVFSAMTYLLMLEADQNEIESAELKPLSYLQVLTLKKNKLTSTKGIEHKALECLELSYNNVSKVNLNPYILESLKILEMRRNLLQSTDGIFIPTLTHLYLAENLISKITGLETLINLKLLHLRSNDLSKLDGFDVNCAKLSYLNLRKNNIEDFSELKKLQHLHALETLIVLENPLVSKEDEEDARPYRLIILTILPNLKRIDKDTVLQEELEEAMKLRRRDTDEYETFA